MKKIIILFLFIISFLVQKQDPKLYYYKESEWQSINVVNEYPIGFVSEEKNTLTVRDTTWLFAHNYILGDLIEELQYYRIYYNNNYYNYSYNKIYFPEYLGDIRNDIFKENEIAIMTCYETNKGLGRIIYFFEKEGENVETN
jgi:hypothetical protein